MEKCRSPKPLMGVRNPQPLRFVDRRSIRFPHRGTPMGDYAPMGPDAEMPDLGRYRGRYEVLEPASLRDATYWHRDQEPVGSRGARPGSPNPMGSIRHNASLLDSSEGRQNKRRPYGEAANTIPYGVRNARPVSVAPAIQALLFVPGGEGAAARSDSA